MKIDRSPQILPDKGGGILDFCNFKNLSVMFEFDHPKQKCLIFVHTLITMATVLFAPVKEFEEGEIENKCKLVSRNSDNGPNLLL